GVDGLAQRLDLAQRLLVVLAQRLLVVPAQRLLVVGADRGRGRQQRREDCRVKLHVGGLPYLSTQNRPHVVDGGSSTGSADGADGAVGGGAATAIEPSRHITGAAARVDSCSPIVQFLSLGRSHRDRCIRGSARARIEPACGDRLPCWLGASTTCDGPAARAVPIR